jgi:hypothetical protein
VDVDHHRVEVDVLFFERLQLAGPGVRVDRDGEEAAPPDGDAEAGDEARKLGRGGPVAGGPFTAELDGFNVHEPDPLDVLTDPAHASASMLLGLAPAASISSRMRLCL